MSLRHIWALLFTAAAWYTSCQAAVLQLSPIPVEIDAPQATGILSLSNRATTPVALQLRVFRWTQEEGKDVLKPSEEVAVSPPISSIPPGQTLSVRIVRLANNLPYREEAFRIWIDELPSEKGSTEGSQLRMLTRYSMPVFFSPPMHSGVESPLSWKLERIGASVRLAAENLGAARVRISGIQLRTADGKHSAFAAGHELSGYALAGQKFAWDVAPNAVPLNAGGRYRLEYDTEAGSHREDITLSTR